MCAWVWSDRGLFEVIPKTLARSTLRVSFRIDVLGAELRVWKAPLPNMEMVSKSCICRWAVSWGGFVGYSVCNCKTLRFPAQVPTFIARCEVWVKFRFLTVCQTNCLIRNEAPDLKAENLIMNYVQGHHKFRRVGEWCEWSNSGCRVARESRRNF